MFRSLKKRLARAAGTPDPNAKETDPEMNFSQTSSGGRGSMGPGGGVGAAVRVRKATHTQTQSVHGTGSTINSNTNNNSNHGNKFKGSAIANASWHGFSSPSASAKKALEDAVATDHETVVGSEDPQQQQPQSGLTPLNASTTPTTTSASPAPTPTQHHHHHQRPPLAVAAASSTPTKSTGYSWPSVAMLSEMTSTTKATLGVPPRRRKPTADAASAATSSNDATIRHKPPSLAAFDACVEAADALAADSFRNNNGSDSDSRRRIVVAVKNDNDEQQQQQNNVATTSTMGLLDCSVLVSPDGNLLLVPTGSQEQQRIATQALFAGGSKKKKKSGNSNNNSGKQEQPPQQHKVLRRSSSTDSADSQGRPRSAALLSELTLTQGAAKDDYESAVFLGNDLIGDRALNFFSAKGWSIPATSVCLEQTATSMQHLQQFSEGLLLAKKQYAAVTSTTCDAYRVHLQNPMFANRSTAAAASSSSSLSTPSSHNPQDWEILDPRASDFEITPNRTGPLHDAVDGTLYRAMAAMEQYYSTVAENEANRWRDASLPVRNLTAVSAGQHHHHHHHRGLSSASGKGLLPALSRAISQLQERAANRHTALQDTYRSARHTEDQLRRLKAVAEQKWKDVYAAEEAVTRRQEDLLRERSRQREQARLEQLLRDEEELQQQYRLKQQALELAAASSSSSFPTGTTSGSEGYFTNADGHNNNYHREMMHSDAASAVSTNFSGAGAGAGADTISDAGTAASQEELWNLVNSVTESMEMGSFAPMDLPTTMTMASMEASKDSNAKAAAAAALANNNTNTTIDDSFQYGVSSNMNTPNSKNDNHNNNRNSNDTDSVISCESLPPPPPLPSLVDRESIEHELGLPTLRALAMAADEVVEDVATQLLNILSSLDTTRRSARVAAETALVSACNAQAATLRALIKLERQSLEERLAQLSSLEQVIDDIDVRADLDKYIQKDKRDRGGSSHLGDDDDGGIASALAVLSSHVDGYMNGHGGGGSRNNSRQSSNSRHTSEEEYNMSDSEHGRPTVTVEQIKEAMQQVFEDNVAFEPSADATDPEVVQARNELETAVDLLCRAATESCRPSRSRRSAICYALNAKRSSHAEITTPLQFDALVRIFAAILTGCQHEQLSTASSSFSSLAASNFNNSGVANAKMCMMLAQTFYIERGKIGKTKPPATEVDDSTAEKTISSRKKRFYIKNKLLGHSLWSKDDFWDEALRQQISESLTHSGVMSNFERTKKGVGRKIPGAKRTQWHDLTYAERIEAASQVHAVVFAQLGALAHSMIEFGCGLERSCAFVRRMAIRNQLPSSQRTMLLQHLMERSTLDRMEAENDASEQSDGRFSEIQEQNDLSSRFEKVATGSQAQDTQSERDYSTRTISRHVEMAAEATEEPEDSDKDEDVELNRYNSPKKGEPALASSTSQDPRLGEMVRRTSVRSTGSVGSAEPGGEIPTHVIVNADSLQRSMPDTSARNEEKATLETTDNAIEKTLREQQPDVRLV